MGVIATQTAIPADFGSGGSGLSPQDSAGTPNLRALLEEHRAALAALDTALPPSMQAVDATLVAGTVTVAAGIIVAADTEVIVTLIEVITGSANFASVGETKSGRVVGGAGVGTVVVQALGADGAADVDAAGDVRLILLNPQ